MSKYSEFPDVIEDQIQIYESAGAPRDGIDGDGGVEHQRTNNNDDIDETQLNVQASQQVFVDKGLDAPQDIDLDDVTIGPKRSYVGGVAEEDLDTRLARLQREVQEVMEQVRQEPQLAHKKNETESLKALLDKASEERAIGRIEMLKLVEPSATATTATSDPKKSNASALAALEKRLTDVENKMGVSHVMMPNPRSLAQSLDVAQKRLSLFINGGEEAINDAIGNLEKLSQLVDKMSGPAHTHAATSDALYHYLDIIESQRNLVTQVNARLLSLQHIHQGAAYTIQRVGELDKTIALMSKDMATWTRSLDTLDAKLVAYDKQAQENRAQFKEWLDTK